MRATIGTLTLTLLGIPTLGAQEYIISTIAGGVPPLTPLAGLQAPVVDPQGVATDSAGNLYFTSGNCVFKLDSSGIMTLVAGNSRSGYAGDGGTATGAELNYPRGLAFDAGGNLYIADPANSVIRKVSPAGIITTFAGNGTAGFSGDGQAAVSAQLNSPDGVTTDAAGNLYIADTSNARIRKVSAAGIITTIAGGGNDGLGGSQGFGGDGGPATAALLSLPVSVALDAAGNLYIADSGNGRIREVSAGTINTIAGGGASTFDGVSATSAFMNPQAVVVDAAGDLYIADNSLPRVRVVSPAGIITTIAGNGFEGFSGDGGTATNAEVGLVYGLARDAAGAIYIADATNSRIRKVSGGVITTVAGNGSAYYVGDSGPASDAQLVGPYVGAIDAKGNLYIVDDGVRVRKISAAGIITTVAGNGSQNYSGDGGPATSAGIGPAAVAVDAGGNLYISDAANNRIRKVSADGTIQTIAGNGRAGYSGDGGPALDAQLYTPAGIAVDANGNVYFADTFAPIFPCCGFQFVRRHNYAGGIAGDTTVRRISSAGIITTVAGTGALGYFGDGGPALNAEIVPYGLAVDTSGNLYIAEPVNQRIRMVSPNGIINTVAGNGVAGYFGDGGAATAAEINYPNDVAVDAGGNLYITDTANSRIRRVSATGTIITIAGNAFPGYSGDGGPAIFADINWPAGVAVDASGNVYFGDSGNSAVRQLTPSNPSCSYAISQTSIAWPVEGGTSTVNIATGAGCAWAVTGLPTWITASGPTTGTGSGTVTLAAAANFGGFRSVEASIANVEVLVYQSSDSFAISAGGVTNAASYATPVAAGSIAAIFGSFPVPVPAAPAPPYPTSIGGLSFQFAGAPLAPMFYAGTGSANVQIPWEVAGQSETTVTATYNGQNSEPQTVSLATYAPGIFTPDGSGAGQGLILNTSYNLVDAGNPAAAGDWVQIFCTGLGPVTNTPATGEPAPLDSLVWTTTIPTVSIGGVTARLNFWGLAPGQVGMYQVNAQLPEGLSSGAVPVTISIGGVESNAVTMAVR